MYPHSFSYNKSKVRAFVLGADPTNFSDHGKPAKIHTVFGIGSGDQRYFESIRKNLESIGLSILDVYVQNLIKEYLPSETSKNREWAKYAKEWLPKTKEEFDLIDPSRKIPVLVTAETIMKFLYPSVPKASDIYSGKVAIPFLNNSLDRKLVPFYRHYEYSLSKESSSRYLEQLVKIFRY